MKLERRTFLKITAGAFGAGACTMAGENLARGAATKAAASPAPTPAPQDPLSILREWKVKPETEPAFVFRAIR